MSHGSGRGIVGRLPSTRKPVSEVKNVDPLFITVSGPEAPRHVACSSTASGGARTGRRHDADHEAAAAAEKSEERRRRRGEP